MCKYSFYANNRSGFDSFLNGMGSLNIFGGSSIYDRYSSPNRADYEAIKKDWEKVGADMKDANNSYSRNYIPKLNETK